MKAPCNSLGCNPSPLPVCALGPSPLECQVQPLILWNASCKLRATYLLSGPGSQRWQ